VATILDSLTFDDVLLVPSYNGIESRKDVSTSVQLGPYWFDIPIISANMDTITGKFMAQKMSDLGGLGILHRFMSIEENKREYVEATCSSRIKQPIVGISLGVSEAEMERFFALHALGANIVCVDIAHAHSKLMRKQLQRLRDIPDIFIIAGNVATYSGADSLVGWGAHAVKVGIGAGSVCTTREKTGFGVPQLTAIMDCAKLDVPVIADGGLRKPGDIVKALAAGATMVMLGGMLAGTDETCGVGYRGMASAEAQRDFFGVVPEWKTAEGISVDVPDKGPVKLVIDDVIGGLRSGLTYAGARTIEQLHRKANFVKITPAIHQEGTPHALRVGG
jgi:IMP dehydrogenase